MVVFPLSAFRGFEMPGTWPASKLNLAALRHFFFPALFQHVFFLSNQISLVWGRFSRSFAHPTPTLWALPTNRLTPGRLLPRIASGEVDGCGLWSSPLLLGWKTQGSFRVTEATLLGGKGWRSLFCFFSWETRGGEENTHNLGVAIRPIMGWDDSWLIATPKNLGDHSWCCFFLGGGGLLSAKDGSKRGDSQAQVIVYRILDYFDDSAEHASSFSIGEEEKNNPCEPIFFCTLCHC